MSESTPLEERLVNLTAGINGMSDGQKIMVNKAFLEHVRDDMVELLELRRAQPDNAPITCDGCGHTDRVAKRGPYVCQACKRGPHLRDYYRRKPEPEGGDRP